MKLEALDHPKTLDLASRLEVELPTAIGYLELLWAFTGKKAPQGNIGKWPDGAIARACYWMGRPEVFLLALQESGFIDPDELHRLTVHDWREHAPGWVRAKLKKADLPFLHTLDASSDSTHEGTCDPPIEPSIQGKGSTSEGKGSKGACAPESVPGLDIEVWNRWFEYRRELRKPIKGASIPEAMAELAGFGADQAEVVRKSIANSWQGLFPLKKTSNVAPFETHEQRLARQFLEAK